MKKTGLLRTVAASVCVIAVLFGASCAKASPAAMTYKDASISEALYKYYVSTYKARYMQMYSDIKDSDEFWSGELTGGKTGEEVLCELIRGNISQTLISAAEFDAAGQKLTSAQSEEIDSYIDDLTDELASGSRSTLNAYLSEFSINVNMLRESLILEKKAELYIDYLYGNNGAEALTDSDRETYYEENYVRFRQIYINNVKVYETDSNGYYIQDENGNYQMRDLTADEATAAAEKIAAVREALERGDDFTEIQLEYSDSKDYTGGYYFSAASASDYLTSVVSAAFTLDEDEWMYVDAAESSGAFFIKRIALDEGGYKAEDNSDFFEEFDDAVMSEKFAKKVDELREQIVENKEFTDSVTVADSPANYYYY